MKVQGNTQLVVVKVGECRCATRAAVCVPCKGSLTQTDDIKTYSSVGSETHCSSVCILCKDVGRSQGASFLKMSDFILDLISESFQQIGF